MTTVQRQYLRLSAIKAESTWYYVVGKANYHEHQTHLLPLAVSKIQFLQLKEYAQSLITKKKTHVRKQKKLWTF